MVSALAVAHLAVGLTAADERSDVMLPVPRLTL